MSPADRYTDLKLKEITVGDGEQHNSTIELADYDSNWPNRYLEIEQTIREALGDGAMLIEHVGSTSVPGLAAKPVIDVLLEVPDADRETDYVDALGSRGFWLEIRELDWYGHRLLKLKDVNLHVFSSGCVESVRMLRFRDWLRAHPDDRDLYLAKKRELASRVWKHVQNYADAKSEVVATIMSKAMSNGLDA